MSSASGVCRVRVNLAADPGTLRARAADPAVGATRAALGIEAWSGAATGHQPTFWHGGILAKAACAAALSRREGQGWMHLVADHDAVDPAALNYPARRGDGALRKAVAHFDSVATAGAAACALAAGPVRVRTLACPLEPASPEVAARLDRIEAALRAADSSSGAAWRTVMGNFALLSACGALDPPAHVIRASSLLSSPLGRECVGRIAVDPELCARAFNDALASAPRAASRLRVEGDRSEVPVWELGARGERLRIDGIRLRTLLRDGAVAEDPREGVRPVLLPRAFLATGIVRALGVPFVHGTGGEAYERAGDRWWHDALGLGLPPFSIATCDLAFSPDALGLADDGSASRITWREAWVDPVRMDGMPSDPERVRAAREIAALPRRSAERRRAFESMRARVAALRAQRQGDLDALAAADAESRKARASRAAAADRTYPAAIHDDEALAALSALVDAAVSASVAASGASGSRR
jgi:hypothetical protein